MAGRNRALPIPSGESYNFNRNYFADGDKKPCIFLSHISVDKIIVESIATYIMEQADIDVYLDIYDDDLQRAVTQGNPVEITTLIERGITCSTHAMCLISNKTINSWWVPYELGYAKKSDKPIASLKLKGDVELPDFLKVGEILMGTKSLNEYIKNLISDFNSINSYSTINEGLESHDKIDHPLDDTLDWNA